MRRCVGLGAEGICRGCVGGLDSAGGGDEESMGSFEGRLTNWRGLQ